MILIGIGANLAGAAGPPRAAGDAALARLAGFGVLVLRRSGDYRSAAVGPGRQPSYLNLVASVATEKPPAALLALFRRVEREFGRAGGPVWGPRPMDIDLLAYHGLVAGWQGGGARRVDRPPAAPRRAGVPIVPHPYLHLRPFVVGPLAAIAPDWHHPVLGETATQMWRRLSRQRAGRLLGAGEADGT